VRKGNGRDWRGVFDDHNKLIGIAEKFGDGWHVFVGGQDVGVVVSPTAAKWVIDRINNDRCRSETTGSIDIEPPVSDSPGGSNPKGKK
jgi:hypothetical protein